MIVNFPYSDFLREPVSILSDQLRNKLRTELNLNKHTKCQLITTNRQQSRRTLTRVFSTCQILNRRPSVRQSFGTLTDGLLNLSPLLLRSERSIPLSIDICVEPNGIHPLLSESIDTKPNRCRTNSFLLLSVYLTDLNGKLFSKPIRIITPIGQFIQPRIGQRKPQDRTQKSLFLRDEFQILGLGTDILLCPATHDRIERLS